MTSMRYILVIAGTLCVAALAGCATDEGATAVSQQQPGETSPEGSAEPPRLSLEDQKKLYEARKEFRDGQTLYAQSYYKAAQYHLQKAVELDPQFEAARELLRICEEQMGLLPPAVSPEQTHENLIRIRIQADMEEAARLVKQARYSLEELKNYEEAFAAAKRAVQIYERMPSKVDVASRLKEAGELAARIAKKRQDEESDLRARQEKAGMDLLERQKVQESERQDREIRRFQQTAMEEMERGDFTAARKLAYEAMLKFPNNPKVRDLDQLVFERFIGWKDRTVRLTEADAWRNQFSKVYEQAIPYVALVSYEASPGDWRKMTAVRLEGERRLKEIFTDTPENAELRNALKNRKLPNRMDFDDKLEDVLAEISEYFNIPIIIDNSLYEEAVGESGSGTLGNITRRLRTGTSLESALKIILEEKHLGYYIRDRVVIVTDKDKVKKEPRMKIYNISDLLVRVADFGGPDISFISETSNTESGFAGLAGGGEVEDEDNIEGVFGVAGSNQLTPVSTDLQDIGKFVTLIKETIAPDTWNVDETDRSKEGYIIGSKGSLMVTHTEQVHEQIENLLKGKRRARSIMVTIEARFLKVSQNFIEDINTRLQGTQVVYDVDGITPIGTTTVPGVLLTSGTSGSTSADTLSISTLNIPNTSSALEGDIAQRIVEKIGSSGSSITYGFLDDSQFNFVITAAKKKERSSVLSAPRVTAYNNQRAYIAILKNSSFVGDTNVTDIGTGTEQTAATSPVVNSIADGIVLDVRPTVSHDMKYVQIELRAAASLADLSNSRSLITRPRQDVATPLLGVASVEEESAVIVLPSIVTSSIKTTVVVPDQGTVLLGGMAQLSMLDAVAEVPWFSKIPVLSFFFTEKAKTDERSNLLLLLRANINIMKELEEKQTGVISED